MEWTKISEDAKNLIKQMLTYEVDKRISASEALNNEWIQKNAPNEPLNSNVLLNLGNFHVFLSKQIILKIIIFYFTKSRPKVNFNQHYALSSLHKFLLKMKKKNFKKLLKL